ncbi:MAG TPA: HEPN domain-containing protein [Candidatus Nanoarchaeia archaeon]|nr:HEPN domain-containing protein [Candidatus Nanoarchaeia archaeon]
MREEIIDWWKQAQADLNSAKNCINSGDFYLAVFMSHQAAEKALKSLCMLKLKESSPGHSLIYLAQKLKVPSEMLTGIRDLNPEYLTSRYPDLAEGVPAELYDRPIAEKHYLTAERVLQWVKPQIQK